MDTAGLSLRDGSDLCGLDSRELWLRYLALGGSAALSTFNAYLAADYEPNAREHDVIAQVLNEAFLDLGIDAFPVATVRVPTERMAAIAARLTDQTAD